MPRARIEALKRAPPQEFFLFSILILFFYEPFFNGSLCTSYASSLPPWLHKKRKLFSFLLFVPRARIELAQPCGQGILSPSCLPIPPPGLDLKKINTCLKRYYFEYYMLFILFCQSNEFKFFVFL